MFDNGNFPQLWSEGLISQVHKKGSRDIADNFRKVTVMPVLNNMFESILNSRLTVRNIILEKSYTLYIVVWL